MGKRAAAVEDTRRRIVDATLELHTSKGIAATRWDEIAERAGVGVGTVYRHFPSLDELVPACGRRAMKLLALPDPSQAETLFAGCRRACERIERLVGEAFALYERGAPVVRATMRERDVHPDLARGDAEIRASLDALVEAALGPLTADPRGRRVARAMVDVAVWSALREQGLDPAEAVADATAMLTARLGVA
jgi:AcrR family transcriptional regulator